jgi:hypothetical protein
VFGGGSVEGAACEGTAGDGVLDGGKSGSGRVRVGLTCCGVWDATAGTSLGWVKEVVVAVAVTRTRGTVGTAQPLPEAIIASQPSASQRRHRSPSRRGVPG